MLDPSGRGCGDLGRAVHVRAVGAGAGGVVGGPVHLAAPGVGEHHERLPGPGRPGGVGSDSHTARSGVTRSGGILGLVAHGGADGAGVHGLGRDGVQAAHRVGRHVQGMSQCRGRHDARAQAGVRAGADAADDGVEVAQGDTRGAHRLPHVRGDQFPVRTRVERDPFAEHPADGGVRFPRVTGRQAHHPGRDGGRRGVNGEYKHPSSVRPPTPPRPDTCHPQRGRPAGEGWRVARFAGGTRSRWAGVAQFAGGTRFRRPAPSAAGGVGAA